MGPPLEVYERPTNTFVAAFLGNPPMNLLPVRVAEGKGRLAVRLGGEILELKAGQYPTLPAGTAITLGIRPESIAEHANAGASGRFVGIDAEIVQIRVARCRDDSRRAHTGSRERGRGARRRGGGSHGWRKAIVTARPLRRPPVRRHRRLDHGASRRVGRLSQRRMLPGRCALVDCQPGALRPACFARRKPRRPLK